MRLLIFLILCSVYSIDISPETWNKEKIDVWLDSIGMRNYIQQFEVNNINSGFKLKYIDQNILDNDFKGMSNLDKKTLLAEINNLFKSPEIPEGIWKAFEMNPRLTCFLFFLFNKSPRLTYLILYYLNPSIINGVLQEDNISFDIKMIIFPELVLLFKIFTLYSTAHSFLSILYSILLVLSFYNTIKGYYLNIDGVSQISNMIIYSLICLIIPIEILKFDVYTIGIISNFFINLLIGFIIGIFGQKDLSSNYPNYRNNSKIY